MRRAAACSTNLTFRKVQWKIFTIHCTKTSRRLFKVITSGVVPLKGGRRASPPSFTLEHLNLDEVWPHIGYEGFNVASARPAMTEVIGTGHCNKRTK